MQPGGGAVMSRRPRFVLSPRPGRTLAGGKRRSLPSAVAALGAGCLGASVLIALLPSAPALAVSTACPWVGSSAPISQRVSEVLAKMTVAQKVALVTGASG